MQDLQAILIAQAQSWTALEAVAVLFAVLYLVLAIRENILCRLYMESVLNVFYFAMAIYGWRVWYRGRSDQGVMPVAVWAPSVHAKALAAIVALSLVSGYLLSRFTDAAFPYVDSATTWGAVWATFLVARKVLENWWYWLVIDIASILIYWSRDLQLTSLLFVAYVIMIPFGLVHWTRSWRESRA